MAAVSSILRTISIADLVNSRYLLSAKIKWYHTIEICDVWALLLKEFGLSHHQYLKTMGFLRLKMAKMAKIKKLLFIRIVDNYILNHSYKKHFFDFGHFGHFEPQKTHILG